MPPDPTTNRMRVPEKVREETRRIRQLQRVVAFVQQVIGSSDTTRGEALRLLEEARRFALGLFPDKGEVYDLIYAPRLHRAYRTRFEGPLRSDVDRHGLPLPAPPPPGRGL